MRQILKHGIRYDPRGPINVRHRKLRVLHTSLSFKVRGMLLLARLGHDLSVREDLAGFVVAAHTGDVLPRLIGHVTLGVIQRDDVLHWWQELKLALWFPPVCQP
jgi:hypothetical protein